DERDRHPFQLAGARDDRVRASLALLGLLEAVDVVLGVGELERVDGPDPARPALERAWVGEHPEAGVHRHAVVMAAPGAGGAVVVLLARGTVPPEEALKRHVASLPAWS